MSFSFRGESCAMDTPIFLFGPKYVKDAVLTAEALHVFPDKGAPTIQTPSCASKRIFVRTFQVELSGMTNFISDRQ